MRCFFGLKASVTSPAPALVGGKVKGKSHSPMCLRGPEPTPGRSAVNLSWPRPRANTSSSPASPNTISQRPLEPGVKLWRRPSHPSLAACGEGALDPLLGPQLSAVLVGPPSSASQPAGEASPPNPVLFELAVSPVQMTFLPASPGALGPLTLALPWRKLKGLASSIPFNHLHLSGSAFYFALLRRSAVNSAFRGEGGELAQELVVMATFYYV